MNQEDARVLQEVLVRIQALSAAGEVRVTQHGQQEMAGEDITLGEVLQAIAAGQILENYPETDVDLVAWCMDARSRAVHCTLCAQAADRS